MSEILKINTKDGKELHVCRGTDTNDEPIVQFALYGKHRKLGHCFVTPYDAGRITDYFQQRR